MGNFSPVSEMRKGQRSWDEFWHEIREAKQTWRNTKAITFEPIIASATLKVVSLQLNGMLMMRKIQQAMRDDAIRAARSHPALFMGFIWQNVQPYSRYPSWKTRVLRNRANPPSHVNTSKILQRIKRDFGNLASPVNQAHVKRPEASSVYYYKPF